MSAAGAARSSLNASVHGLRSGRLAALPHEDPQEVEHHRQVWRAELGAESPAEIEVADSIALLRWKLRRIDEVEQRRLASEVLIRIDQAPEKVRMDLIDGALAALAAMANVMSTTFPSDMVALNALLAPVDATLAMLLRVEDSGPGVFAGHRELDVAVGVLREREDLEVDPISYAAVITQATIAAERLRQLVPAAVEAVEAARGRIALDLPLPGDPDVARRVRYRRDCERQLEAEMRFLVLLRDRRKQVAASGSFGLPVPA